MEMDVIVLFILRHGVLIIHIDIIHADGHTETMPPRILGRVGIHG